MSHFHALRVDDLRPETRDAVVMTLSVPEELADTFRFTQGQYLTLRSRIDGEEVRRSYSICAAVQDGLLRVGIKKVPGGVFSNWVADKVEPGQTIEVMPPAGSFFTPLDGTRRRHYLAFAAGSGITPVFGIVKTTLLAEPLSQFTLVYGNRASGSIMFREELEDLKNRFLGRLNLVHVLSREKQDIELFNGRIDRAKCDALFSYWIDVSEVDTAFICGPQSMMLEVADALEAHGLDRRQIKFELFGVASAPTARPAEAAGAAPAGCRATVVLDGVARDIDIEPGGETVLDAGLRQGLELPFACKGGVCSTCRAMLVEGEVDMDANFALEDYEIARGYILTCQSYPVTDRVVVDYDQQ